jgi:hypothetical protein
MGRDEGEESRNARPWTYLQRLRLSPKALVLALRILGGTSMGCGWEALCNNYSVFEP